MTSQIHLQQKVAALKLKLINPTKCVPKTSLYHQILGNSQATVDNQNRKFNLGNGQLFTDPIMAADQLLEREYFDSSLFDVNCHGPVFIPPVFQSNQYKKTDSSVHLLDYDVDVETFKKSLDNLMNDFPNHWFTHELKSFYNLQVKNPGDQINAKELNNWMFNVKIMYLLVKELGTNKVNLPSTTSDNSTFIQACIQGLTLTSPGTSLEQILKKVTNYTWKSQYFL